MPFRFTSSRTPTYPGRKWLLLAAAGLMMVLPAAASALENIDAPVDPFANAVDPFANGVDPFANAAVVAEPDATAAVDPFANAAPATITDAAAVDLPAAYALDLYLDILINGRRREKIVAIHQDVDGNLSATRADLAEIGLLTPPGDDEAPESRVLLASLPDVTYVYDEVQQTIDFTAPETARARLIVDASGRTERPEIAEDPDTQAGGFGVLVNYDLYAGASMTDGGSFSTATPSGSFQAKMFGPFGLLEQGFSLRGETLKFQRLNTTWSYSDPTSMRTYRAGDIATGALSWTRPTRLGGLQVQNDFGLRSDIVTHPIPSISGSAALPSSVEIYINNQNRYSGEVLEGPFEIVGVPVLTGAGTIELVVTDVTGNEVRTKADYFASPRLLRPGLFDYSAELGFARTGFGTNTDAYDRRLMGSGSIRAGVTDWLTWEGHAEGGMDLLNAGTGVVATLGRLGVGQFSLAASRTAEAMGAQLTGSLQLGFGNVSVGARAQKSFGRYEDVASITAPDVTDHTSPTPSSLYQLSLSLPSPFEGGRANLSYTHLEPASGDAAQIIAASYGQRLFEGSGSATAYADLKSGRYGASMSLWMPLGGEFSTRSSARHTEAGTTLSADISRAGGSEVGDVGWSVSVDHGKQTDFSASARTRLPAASVRAKLKHSGGRTGLTAQLSGAVVAADGGLFLAPTITDAFAVVNVGAPNVPVFYQNRPVGRTGKDGKLIVPGLTAYAKNRISIDPTALPLDQVVESTTAIAIPARGSGVIVSFGKRNGGGSALISFRDSSGNFLPLASTGMAGADATEFTVGYDGEAFVEGLGADNIVTISLPDGSSCIAQVPYADQGGELVSIPDIVCQPV